MSLSTDAGGVEMHVVHDAESGLRGVIALHSTALGPAAGGCRLWNYENETRLRCDASRLAVGMSYKNALAELPFGGGKAVLQRPREPFSRSELFRAFGRAVERLGGTYVTAEDVGSTEADMVAASETTRYVAGLPRRDDSPGGDPSPWTARGVFLAMEMAAQRRLQRSLRDCVVAIQGVGNVGAHLATLLHAAGAKLVIADTDAAAAARVAVRTGADICAVNAIARVEVDIFAPCALGGSIDTAVLQNLKAAIVCGAANNQLATADQGTALAARGILYAPDYVVNAGGIINVAAEYLGWSQDDVERRVDAISARLAAVCDLAEARGIATADAADELARARIAAAGHAANKAA